MGRSKYEFNSIQICPSCRREEESLFYILIACRACAHLWERAFREIVRENNKMTARLNILSSQNIKTVKKFVTLLSTILLERLNVVV